ncbi:MAG: META domain-containing protein [Deltaproteobacteria bacterium]|nr:MAG: META domain-containing protein [Deltaproteobacteria bacterium]
MEKSVDRFGEGFVSSTHETMGDNFAHFFPDLPILQESVVMKKKLLVWMALVVAPISMVLAGAKSSTTDPALYNRRDSRWVLLYASTYKVGKRGRATLRFLKGRVSGSGGCNYYVARKSKVQKGFFLLKGITMTARACKFLHHESAYINLLSKANRYKLHGKMLSLFADQELLLKFRYRPPTPDAPLTKGTWILSSWIFQPGSSTLAMAMHSKDTHRFRLSLLRGSIKGETPCGTFEASYSMKGRQFRVGNILDNTGGCQGEAKKDLDRFFRMLPKIKTYQLRGKGLTLSINRNNALQFFHKL